MTRTSSSLISAMEMLLISMLDVASLRLPTDAIRWWCTDPLPARPPPEDGVHGGGVAGSTVCGAGMSLGAPSVQKFIINIRIQHDLIQGNSARSYPGKAVLRGGILPAPS